jgi:hypothetical protein
MVKSLMKCALALPLAIFTPCVAQQWEVGGALGYGFYRNQTVSTGTTEATAGFRPGFGFSIFGGEDLYRHIGGELRYTYRNSDLKLKSGSRDLSFAGDAHAIHYDFLFHASPKGSRIRPFLAAGGGVKIFRGTDSEAEFQPLSDLALFTRATEVKPLISVGAGIRFAISRNATLRMDIRDYISPFPKEVIVPVPPAQITGWLHNFMPMVGIGLMF